MLPFIAAGIAIVGVGTAVYKYFSSDDDPKDIGRIALWGMEETGKTTLISRLKNEYVSGVKPNSTNLRANFKDIKFNIADKEYIIKSISDSSGIKEAKKEWLDEAGDAKVIVYLVNMEKYIAGKLGYQGKVHVDLVDIETLDSNDKKLIIVGTHIDKTPWAQNPSLASNDDSVLKLMSKFKSFTPKFYAVNLLDDNSYSAFLERSLGSLK